MTMAERAFEAWWAENFPGDTGEREIELRIFEAGWRAGVISFVNDNVSETAPTDNQDES